MSDVTSFDGTRLALETAGPEGAPTVVLVHGLGLSTESWGDVPVRLAGAHRVVAYDLRGHAQSGDARSGDYTLEAHARDLDAVLTACVPDGGGRSPSGTASAAGSSWPPPGWPAPAGWPGSSSPARAAPG